MNKNILKSLTLIIFFTSIVFGQTGYYHGVLVGINDYPGTINDLSWCVADAQGMKQQLISYQGWIDGNVPVLTDGQAYKSNIQSNIQAMPRSGNQSDLFHYSGHGSESGLFVVDQVYLTPSNLQSYFGNSYNQYASFLDACYSGIFPRDMTNGVISSACRADELSSESGYLQHGTFSYFLIQGLTNNTAGTGGLTSAEQLHAYAAPRTTSYDGGMHPQLKDNYSGSLTLNLYVYVPEKYSTIASALSVAVSGQTVAVSNSQTLSANANIPSGVTLKINSGATITLNGYSILTSGGTITVESGAAITGVRAYLKNGTTTKGYCGSINTACNSAVDFDLVDIQSGAFAENISFSGKNYVNITGKGIGQTNISIYSSNYVSVSDVTCKSVTSNSSHTFVHGNINKNDMNPVTMALMAYNSTGYCGGTIQGGFFGYFAFGSTYNVYIRDGYGNTSITNNRYGVHAGGNSNVTLYRNNPNNYVQLCGNLDYEFSAETGSTINAINCSYPSGSNYPRIASGGGTVYINGKLDCSGGQMAKSSNGNSNLNGTESVTATSDSEFDKMNSKRSELEARVYDDIATKRKFDKEKFSKEYKQSIDEFKSFIQNHPNSAFAKTALVTASHTYKQLGEYDSLQIFLKEIGESKKLAAVSPLAKRLMIDYYSHQKDFNKALLTADEILAEQKTDTTLICDVLYAKALIYAHDLNKTDDAVVYLTSIVNNYADNSMSYAAINELQLLGFEANKETKGTVSNGNTGFSISNYPNPFNPITTIKYSLMEATDVNLTVYDYLGREVKTLVNGFKNRGEYSVSFDANNLASGIYFYKLQAGKNTAVKKMLLVK